MEEPIELEKKTVVRLERPKKKQSAPKIVSEETKEPQVVQEESKEPIEEPKEPQEAKKTPNEIFDVPKVEPKHIIKGTKEQIIKEELHLETNDGKKKITRKCSDACREAKLKNLQKAHEARRKRFEEDLAKVQQIQELKASIKNRELLFKAERSKKAKILEDYVERLKAKLEEMDSEPEEEPNVVIETKERQIIKPTKAPIETKVVKQKQPKEVITPVYLTKEQYLRSLGL